MTDQQGECLYDGLTEKQRRFVESYVVHLNASRASREAGYDTTRHDQQGYENLRKPEISAVINKILDDQSMSVGEGLRRLTDWGRGNIGHFLTPTGFLDLTTDQAQENLHLIKKVKVVKRIERAPPKSELPDAEIISTEIELHDAKDAVVKTLEAHGKLKPAGDNNTNITIFQIPQKQP